MGLGYLHQENEGIWNVEARCSHDYKRVQWSLEAFCIVYLHWKSALRAPSLPFEPFWNLETRQQLFDRRTGKVGKALISGFCSLFFRGIVEEAMVKLQMTTHVAFGAARRGFNHRLANDLGNRMWWLEGRRRVNGAKMDRSWTAQYADCCFRQCAFTMRSSANKR